MADVEEAVQLCLACPDSQFVGPRDQATIAAAEAALGLSYPPSYRLFVERLGAGGIGSFEIYGVIDSGFDGPVPDGVWATLDSRAGPSRLPRSMIVIGEDGMGGEVVLNTAKGAEPPVEVWCGGASQPGDSLERLALDFGAFLAAGVRDQIRNP